MGYQYDAVWSSVEYHRLTRYEQMMTPALPRRTKG